MSPARRQWLYRSLLLLAGLGVGQGCSSTSPGDGKTSPLGATAGDPPDDRVIARQLPPTFTEATPTLQWDFAVANDTGKTVRLLNVEPSCACSKAELEAKELQPGQETVLHVQADLRGRSGPQRFSCRVLTDAGLTWRYEATTTLYQRVQLTPVPLSLGLLNPSTEATATAVLHLYAPPGEEPPALLSIGSASEQVQVAAAADAVEVQPDGVGKRTIPVRVTLAPQANPGRGESQVVAVYALAGSEQEARLPIVWNVQSLYRITPPRAFFGYLQQSGGQLQRRLAIRRTDGKALVIRKVETTNPAVQGSAVDRSAGGEQQILLTLDLAKVPGPLWGEAVVETDDPIQPRVRVPYSALR